MPHCLYCRTPTTGEEGRAHALPEAIVANNLIMPPGSQCNSCNNYLKRLDSALASYSGISLWIQALGLPGKKGRPRQQLGWFKRARDQASSTFTIEPEGIHHIDEEDTKPLIAVRTPRGWKQSEFHRALHCVAFNILSLQLTEQQLIDASFDQVRNYIRYPRRGEVWPYCAAILGTKYVPRINISVLMTSTWQVALQFFNQIFVVELIPAGALLARLSALAPSGVTWQEIRGRRS
jgi:hypothetical protein